MLQVRLNKWLNELEQMFYGMSFAFDKSLSGDEDMTSALLRNVYNDDKSKQKTADILARYATRSELDYLQYLLHNMCCCDDVVSVLCRELACLAKTESEHVMSGRIKFSSDLFDE